MEKCINSFPAGALILIQSSQKHSNKKNVLDGSVLDLTKLAKKIFEKK